VDEREAWSEDEEERVLNDVLLPVALSRFDGASGDADSIDTKSLGVLALAAAAIAVLVAVHDGINRHWPIGALSMAAAGVLLVFAIWPRSWDFGPNLEAFYSEMSGAPRVEASRQMLSELLASVDKNDMTNAGKFRWYRAGLAVFVLALVVCVPIALVRPH
jgi:hypothetical protein